MAARDRGHDQDEREASLRSYRQKGSNQIAVRSYNERLILQLVREHGTLTKAEASRATGLSANATSVIFRSLEAEGLLTRDKPIRGRIGQPSTPMRINAGAQRYVALKIGRRTLELAVVDFSGRILGQRRRALDFPTPERALDFFRSELSGLLRSVKASRKAISGMGIAMPFELWSWTEEFGAPRARMDAWRSFDAAAEFGRLVSWPIMVENDGTAACRAEQVFGPHRDWQDWIYFFVGTFIGGGIVLNGSVFPGRRGNSGGFGPLRVPMHQGGDRLVDHASLIVLERSISQAGGEPFAIHDADADWDAFEPQIAPWLARAAESMAHAIASSLAVLDFEAVVVDGAMPDRIRDRLVGALREQLQRIDRQGIQLPAVEAGIFGHDARIAGSAAAFVSAGYMIDQNTLMRG